MTEGAVEDSNPMLATRERLGWSQARMGRELGISGRHVRNIEQGKYKCSRVMELALKWIEHRERPPAAVIESESDVARLVSLLQQQLDNR